MKTRPAPPYGRDFWPRTRRPEVQADVDYDRPCGNCDYNLRGIAINSPCPECGSVGGINTTDETIAWDARSNLLTFIETVLMALFRPHTFARLVWSPVRFDAIAARRFRRIALWIGTVSVCLTAEELTRQSVGIGPALCALPFELAAIFLWLNAASLDPIGFIKGTASPVSRRAEIVAHYTSSALVLLPLQLLLLPLTSKTLLPVANVGWILTAGVHLLCVLVLMLPAAVMTAWTFHELVDVTPTRAMGFAFSRTMTTIGASLPMLIGVSALAASVAKRFLGV